MSESTTVDAFIEAGSVPVGTAHASGTVEEADRIRHLHPEVVRASIHAASVAGDDAAVREWIARDASLAVTPGGPRDWAPLVYLCFSRYLRLDPSRSEEFVGAARALLAAGADANGGFFDAGYSDQPEWECVLYGAAGVAHHEGVTRALLEHGADPNDGEVAYHAGETYEPGVVRALLESGRLGPDSLAVLLVRKADFHDRDGVALLLDHGANPNAMTGWGITPLHQAVRRDNAAPIVETMLARGGDPRVPLQQPLWSAGDDSPRDAVSVAAWRGRADLLALFAAAGADIEPDEPHVLVAACARGDAEQAARLAAERPAQLATLQQRAGEVLSLFAGNGNSDGIRCLVGLGLSPAAVWPDGDGYFEIPSCSTALHVAAWRGQHDAVATLLAAGAPVEARDGSGRTPLAQAVRACVASYWQDRRRPDSIAALLQAGADPTSIALPTGYDEADRLIGAAQAGR